LHASTTPPTFVLSQDQTLQLKKLFEWLDHEQSNATLVTFVLGRHVIARLADPQSVSRLTALTTLVFGAALIHAELSCTY
jgi:hypothetical protein